MSDIKLAQDIRVLFSEVEPYLNMSVCNQRSFFHSYWVGQHGSRLLVLELINVYVPYLALKPGESKQLSPTKSKAM